MIRINNYLHRETFFDLIRRWMYDQAQPSDAELITRMVHFNNVYIARYLTLFAELVFCGLHGKKLTTKAVQLKRDLKDVITAHPHYINDRIEQLILGYRRHPERYYRETPFHASLYFLPEEHGDHYVGSSRIKRVRRLAEKSARRIIDSIFEAIKHNADLLADDRARRLGIPHDQLITRPEDMVQEFFKAEERLVDDLKNGRPITFEHQLIINDIAGIKVIAEDNDFARVLSLLRSLDHCQVIEEEPHRGAYNAVNVIVKYSPPKETILTQPLSEKTVALMTKRGLDPARILNSFVEFVQSGEEAVHLEVIICNYQEMLESEVGRCMHEDRIMNQRLAQEYRGYLARNVEYLMVYLFNLSVSPQIEVGEIPIKIWNHYLPDTFDEIIRGLFDIPPLRLVQ